MNSHIERSIWEDRRTVGKYLAKTTTIKLAKHWIDFAIWIVSAGSRCISHRFIYNVKPVMANAPADGKDRHGSQVAAGHDVDPGILTPRRKHLTGKFLVGIGFFLIGNPRIAEELKRS